MEKSMEKIDGEIDGQQSDNNKQQITWQIRQSNNQMKKIEQQAFQEGIGTEIGTEIDGEITWSNGERSSNRRWCDSAIMEKSALRSSETRLWRNRHWDRWRNSRGRGRRPQSVERRWWRRAEASETRSVKDVAAEVAAEENRQWSSLGGKSECGWRRNDRKLGHPWKSKIPRLTFVDRPGRLGGFGPPLTDFDLLRLYRPIRHNPPRHPSA